MKQAAALHDESDFVFVMPVFAAELREHGVQVRGLRADVDHIGGHVAAGRLQFVDLVAVRLKHRVGAGVRGHAPLSPPIART